MLIHSKIEATDVFDVHIKSTLKQTNKKGKFASLFQLKRFLLSGARIFSPTDIGSALPSWEVLGFSQTKADQEEEEKAET